MGFAWQRWITLNVDDMYKFAIALAGQKLLSESTTTKCSRCITPIRDSSLWLVCFKNGERKSRRHQSPGRCSSAGLECGLSLVQGRQLCRDCSYYKSIRAGSIRRYAMNDLADIVLFDKAPAMPDSRRLIPQGYDHWKELTNWIRANYFR